MSCRGLLARCSVKNDRGLPARCSLKNDRGLPARCLLKLCHWHNFRALTTHWHNFRALTTPYKVASVIPVPMFVVSRHSHFHHTKPYALAADL